ncbi:hypothetical protein [Sphingopyxis sp.]|uniref:hypothetical protein n=1 Tax=Sphingopyxis sp. TaxID=1908224 RepID=UPI003D0BC001
MVEIEAIRVLLWDEWDPIGVNETSCLINEYDAYAGEIQTMIQRDADAEEIARHLSRIVNENMGLDADHGRALAVARKLVALRS